LNQEKREEPQSKLENIKTGQISFAPIQLEEETAADEKIAVKKTGKLLKGMYGRILGIPARLGCLLAKMKSEGLRREKGLSPKDGDSTAVVETVNKAGFLKNWISSFKGRMHRKPSPLLQAIGIILIILVLLTGTVAMAKWWDEKEKNEPIKAYEVWFGGNELGVVRDVKEVGEIIEGIKREFADDYQMDVVLPQALESKEVYIKAENIGSLGDVDRAIRRYVDVKVAGTAILVDGQPATATKTLEDAQWVLNEILAPYEAVKDKREIEEIGFMQKVELMTQPVDFSRIQTKGEAYKTLALGTDEENFYEVQEGDSLWKIAKRFKLKLSDIRKANPAVAATNLIRPKMKLNLIKPKNLVDVKVVEIEEYTDSMPFETELREDKSLYKTQEKVIQKGKEGKREVVAKVIKINGVESEREILSEKVIKKPVKKIVAKGTKPLPKNASTAVASLGLPARGRISSRFGQRWGRLHAGVDIAAPTGTPIYAAKDGRVSYSGYRGGYGKLVEINHGNGLVTRYGHCSKLLVSSGKRVKKGQLIALVGNTGNSKGPHLHFEVRINGKPVDPLKWLK
jgi:murein DD-endopeptidase MepM/ murein hydrolase activator NlpD